MRHLAGFTLVELITCLAVAAILVALAAPSFNDLIRNNRVEAAANTFIESTKTARSYAVKSNKRVSMSTRQSWDDGWQIYYDLNHNGQLDSEEKTIASIGPLSKAVDITGNQFVADYISYLGTGESHWATGSDGGAFQAGTILVCPHDEGEGYQLILSRGGRLRKESYACDGSA